MMEFHPLCLLLPAMTESEFALFSADVAKNGQRRQIVTYEGKILDGRHRYRALRDLGLKDDAIRFVDWRPRYDGDTPALFVESELPARIWSASQRAAIVVSLRQFGAPAATVGRPKGNQALSDELPKSTLKERADQAGVGETTMKQAERIARKDPELNAQVASGKVTAKAALAKVKADGEVATPAPAPAPGPVKALKLTEVQRLKKRIADLEGELLIAQQEVAQAHEDRQRAADFALQVNDEMVALQALRDGEEFKLIAGLQDQLKLEKAARDSGDRTREVMQVELKRLQRMEAKWQKAQDAAKKK